MIVPDSLQDLKTIDSFERIGEKQGECVYTPIGEQCIELSRLKRYSNGYNFFSDLGVEASGKAIACCLTAYNEPLQAFTKSLSSLSQCGEYFKSVGEERLSRQFIICIIVDGLQSMSPDFSEFAENLGIFKPHDINKNADFHLFESKIRRSDLDVNSQQYKNVEALFPVQSVSMQRVILFIKNENKGKLNSHHCFFEVICRLYSSSYFVQIDVGTCPEKGALFHMWKDLDSHPHVAATAARSHLESPDKRLDLLKSWQFSDIALERIIHWPVEILMGNLSVLPGQLSLTRIASVTGEKTKNTMESNNILGEYYRGMDQLNPFESNKFLAEDRVLGMEMVFQERGEWELSYEIDAEAIVDSCETWTELCRQRRRWICSSLACRIAMFPKLSEIFKNVDRSARAKLHKTLAAFYFLVVTLFDWLIPASHVAAQTVLMNMSMQTLGSTGKKVVLGFGLLVLLSLTMQLYIAWSRKHSERIDRLVSMSLWLQITYLFSNLVLVALAGMKTFTVTPVLLMILASLACYICLAGLYSRSLSLQVLKNIFLYTFARLPVNAYLLSYSIFNAHDTSWGTKGLTSVDPKINYAGNQYQIFRLSLVALFLVSNIAVIFVLGVSGLLSSQWFALFLLSVVLLHIGLAFAALVKIRHWTKNGAPL